MFSIITLGFLGTGLVLGAGTPFIALMGGIAAVQGLFSIANFVNMNKKQNQIKQNNNFNGEESNASKIINSQNNAPSTSVHNINSALSINHSNEIVYQ